MKSAVVSQSAAIDGAKAHSPIRVAVAGAGGRMGSEAVRAIAAAKDMVVTAEIRRGDDLAQALERSQANALVELTLPECVMPHIRIALARRVVPIVGTTGLSVTDLDEIRALCARHEVGALVAPNFAIGALLMMRFAAEAARYLPDVEIIEMHHEQKRDAPSGTAVKTAEMIALARTAEPRTPPTNATSIGVGARGQRGAGDIPIHSVRLPGFVASQEVLFGGDGQRLTLRHDSIDRASFMPGVLLAIRHASQIEGLVYGLENLL